MKVTNQTELDAAIKTGEGLIEIHFQGAVALGNSRVEAWENSRVEAWENSRVEAWENSRVEAWENAHLLLYSTNAKVKADPLVTVILFCDTKNVTGGIQICNRRKAIISGGRIVAARNDLVSRIVRAFDLEER